MENTQIEKFESLWSDFLTLVNGKLISVSKKQTLSTPLAKLILSDAAGLWSDEYSVYGRWIQQLSQEDCSKASLVKDVLLKDMTFADVESSGILPDYCNYLIPAIGACGGFAISHFLQFGKIAQAAFILIPAVLLYPAVKVFRGNQVEKATEASVKSYMSQLDKYKNSILSILS